MHLDLVFAAVVVGEEGHHIHHNQVAVEHQVQLDTAGAAADKTVPDYILGPFGEEAFLDDEAAGETWGRVEYQGTVAWARKAVVEDVADGHSASAGIVSVQPVEGRDMTVPVKGLYSVSGEAAACDFDSHRSKMGLEPADSGLVH